MTMKSSSELPPVLRKSIKTALILSGGGARAAYQVGVLRAISKLAGPKAENPFQIVCGTSAGAYNAVGLAMDAGDFRKAVCRLAFWWKNLRVDQVYRTDFLTVSKYLWHWVLSTLVGGLGKHNPRSLLDNSPLKQLLLKVYSADRVQNSINAGAIDALAISVSGYSSGQSVSFFHGHSALGGWQRSQRLGVPARIEVEHILASSAIPLVFPAVHINREFFCDGSIRQTAPISPALHLGAHRVMVIGVTRSPASRYERTLNTTYPSLAQVMGHMLNSAFIDAMDSDLERLMRVNATVGLIPPQTAERVGLPLHHVDVLVINPSRDLEHVAALHTDHFPRTIRFLLRGLGGLRRRGAVLASYLLFDHHYTRDLMQLGFDDTMNQRDEVIAFLGLSGTGAVRLDERSTDIADASDK